MSTAVSSARSTAPRPTPRRAAPTRRRPDLYVVGVAPRRLVSRGRRTGAVLVVATIVVFGSLLASAIFHSLLVSGQTHLDDVSTQIRTEREQLERDRLELAGFQSPERIAREARRLGMVPTDRQTWIAPDTDSGPVVTGEGSSDPSDPSPGTSPNTAPTDADRSGSELASGHTSTGVGEAR